MALEVKSYPLYDELLRHSDKIVPDQAKLSVMINKMNSEKFEVIYSLILHHAILNKSLNHLKPVPYEAKFLNGKTGPIFKIQNLPPVLIKVLWLYVDRS